MENIWDYLRGNKLSKRVWDSYEAIVAACKDAWHFLIGDPGAHQFHRSPLLGMGQPLRWLVSDVQPGCFESPLGMVRTS